MNALMRARAGHPLVTRRTLLQPAPSLIHVRARILNTAMSRTGTHLQQPAIRRTFGNKPYIPQELHDDADLNPKIKPKGRWVWRFIMLANLSMFALIYKCRANLDEARKLDDDARLAKTMSDMEADGYEMTTERKRILAKWDKAAVDFYTRVLGSCSTSLDKFMEEDYLSFFLSPISHVDAVHLGINMLALFFLGRAWMVSHPTIGFGRIAFGAAAAGNIGQYGSNYLHGKTEIGGLGASGMTSGIAGALVTTVPFRNIYDLAIMVGIQWAIDGYSIANPRSGDRIGHGAHLGGAAFGVLYGLLLRRRL